MTMSLFKSGAVRAAALLCAASAALAAAPGRPAARSGDAAALAPLMRLVVKKGMDDITYKGGLAAVLGIPDQTKTKTELLSARKTTDGLRHLCSVTFAPSPDGKPAPSEFVFWANKKDGSANEDFYARVSLDGKLLKAILREDKPDEGGRIVRGAAQPMALDVKSPEARDRARHELNLWLFGESLVAKHGKKHLKRLDKFRDKPAHAQSAGEPAPGGPQEAEPDADE